MKSRFLTAFCISFLFLCPNAYGQDVFLDNFNSDSSGSYRILKVNPDRDGVEFAFDYGALGIPEAPSSPDSEAKGIQLWANNPAPGTSNGSSAVQIVPQGVGSSLVNKSYRMSFDVWMNVNGPLPAGGVESTEAFMAGVGWNGGKPIQFGVQNGTYLTVTGEGGSSTDLQVVTSAGLNPDGVIIGPSPDTSDPYYSSIFPGGVNVAELLIQGAQDSQTGTTTAGQMAFQWHRFDIDVSDGAARFYVDDLLMAQTLDSDVQGSVMIGYGDYMEGESDAPQWSFGVVDNLRISVVPEPSGLLLFACGILCFSRSIRQRSISRAL